MFEGTIVKGNFKLINYHKVKHKKILKLLEGLRKDAKILDIGCEYGGVTALLHRNGYKKVRGIDLDGKIVKEAKRRYPEVNFSTGNLHNVDFGKYNAFIIWGVFEFVLDLPKLMEKIYLQMKPGAVLIFAVPNICSFSKRLRCLAGLNPNRDDTCFKTFTQKQIESFVRKFGFRRIFVTSLGVDSIKNICFPMPDRLSTEILVKVTK